MGPKQTPDYDVYFDRRKVVTEVKEIEPSPAERAASAATARGEFVVVSITPGQKVRGKITDAGPQIKSKTRSRYPGLLVLFERALLPHHLDEYQVRVAMFGFESVVLNVPADPRRSPYAIGRKYAGRRKMTPQHSTSISALAILRDTQHGPQLTVFHNPHARIELWPDKLSKYGIPQYKLAEAKPNSIAQWKKLE